MKEKKQQPNTSKKSSHNTLDWVEKQLRKVEHLIWDYQLFMKIKMISSTKYRKASLYTQIKL